MNNNNKERITNFLEYWRDIALENPKLSFTSEEIEHAIYSSLIRLGVNQTDRQIDLRNGNSPTNYRNDNQYSYLVNPNSAFNNWLEYYNKKEKINVFHDSKWAYYCQFISQDLEAKKAKEHIKIYIPLDSKHIEQGAKNIFDFLTQNKISHVSKIGKSIRFDDIVVRLVKKEDADKLLNYLKNDSYIQEGLIKANPFAFQKDGIAIVCDGKESYNDTISKLVRLYIAEKIKSKTLNQVSYEDFYRFVAIKYKTNFITRTEKEFKEIFDIQTKEKERNIREIIALALKCQNPNFDYNSYLEHFRICKKNKEEVTSNTLNKNQTNLLFEETEALKLLTEYIKTMCEKYTEDKGKATCKAYFLTGNTSYIARDNNLRERINSSNLREYVIKISNQKNIPILELINQVYLNTSKII